MSILDLANKAGRTVDVSRACSNGESGKTNVVVVRNSIRKVTVKIGLERVDTKGGVTVETLLDSGIRGLVISLEFVRK